MATTTPNMNLTIPTTGVDTGAQSAAYINNDLNLIDQHDHTPGHGVPINSGAISIDADLSFNGYSINTLASLTLVAQTSAPSSNLTVYVAGSDLYFKDGAGNEVQITLGGNVNATSSGISDGTASAAFSAGVLVVNADTNKPANIQGASILLGNNVTNSKFLTLSPPNAMAADFALVLPSIPATAQYLAIDTSGNITAQAAAPVTRASSTSVGLGGVAISNSSGTFTTTGSNVDVTNLSVTITTSGNPVHVMLIGESSNNSFLGVSTTSSLDGSAAGEVALLRDGSTVSTTLPSITGGTGQVGYTMPPGSFQYVDPVAAGTYTYKVQASAASGDTTSVRYCRLVAYEL